MILKKDFTYVDLFAGIGGFHCAMDAYSKGKAKCILASEIDPNASKVYHDNFPDTKLVGDIHSVDPADYKSFDVVCAGFPCQAFSKAGKQGGFKDPRGTLFRQIIRIVEHYPLEQRPRIMILENVRNLISHDHGETWKTIKHEIQSQGYNIVDKPIVIAPKDIGIPQLRDRAIILAVRKDIYDGAIDLKVERKPHGSSDISIIINHNLSPYEKKKYAIAESGIYALDCWDDFISHMKRKTMGFPIWSDEFGQTYDISSLPLWKQDFINKNRHLYQDHKAFIDKWRQRWDIKNKLTPTNRKFEWQAGEEMASVYDGIIQFRPSGIRVKRPTESPALVAMVQRPIYGPERRFITPEEASKLQSFPKSYKFNEVDFLIYKQLGNAVNVGVIKEMFSRFVDFLNKKEGQKNG
jgi:DNA (cytosine-5)-methyltransferase 1